jgi:putative transposase
MGSSLIVENELIYIISSFISTVVYDEWAKSFEIRRELLRDEFVIMPNHFHGIVWVVDATNKLKTNARGGTVPVPVETSGRTSLQPEPQPPQQPEPQPPQKSKPFPPGLPPKSVSSFMAGVKSIISKRINILRGTPGDRVLQYRFHDHLIRNENELFRIRQYIRNNPGNWEIDSFKKTDGSTVRENMMEYGCDDWMIVA